MFCLFFNWYLSNVKSLFADNSGAEPTNYLYHRNIFMFLETFISPFLWVLMIVESDLKPKNK